MSDNNEHQGSIITLPQDPTFSTRFCYGLLSGCSDLYVSIMLWYRIYNVMYIIPQSEVLTTTISIVDVRNNTKIAMYYIYK